MSLDAADAATYAAAAKLLAYRRDFPTFARRELKIQTKGDARAGSSAAIVPFKLFTFQRRLFEQMAAQQERQGIVRQVWLKSRQLGSSTLSQGVLFWRTALFSNTNSIVVAHDDGTAKKIFEMSQRFYDRLSPDIRPMSRYRTKGTLEFENPNDRARVTTPGLNSRLTISTAKNIHSGAGGTFHNVQLCLDPETIVWTPDGYVPVRTLAPGDAIVTGMGDVAKVRAAVTRPSDGRPWVRVKLWGAPHHPLVCTADHPVLTAAGWKPAGTLTRRDRVLLPMRALSPNPHHTFDLSAYYAPRYSALKHRTYERWRPNDAIFPLTADTGWLLGVFLAEGSTKWGGGQVALHVDERTHAERFQRLVAPWVAKTRLVDRSIGGGPKTLVVQFDSAGFSEFLREHFYDGRGHRAPHKRVPSWVWDSPRPFVQGLVEGFVFGDGGTSARGIVITTTSPSLASHVRDLLMTLGYGWPSIRFRAGGDRCGRHEQDSWTLFVKGPQGQRLARECWGRAWRDGRGDTSKWSPHYPHHLAVRVGGVTCVLAQPEMTDVEVDDLHHSFRLVGCVVKNSEAARYVNPEEIVASTLQTVPRSPWTCILVESTARPEGEWFHEMYRNAKRGIGDYEAAFIGAQHDPTAWVALTPDEAKRFRPSKEERQLMRRYGLTPEQVKFRRLKIDSEYMGDTDGFAQEYPYNEDECWITKGMLVFPREHLAALAAGIIAPMYRGDVAPGGRILRSHDGPLSVWEPPQEGVMYDIGVDTAMGREGGDWSVAEVMRRDTQCQVAEYRVQCEPSEFTERVAYLGYAYNTAHVNVELTGDSGYFVNTQLTQTLSYPNLYIWRYRDHVTPKLSTHTGWLQTQNSKRYAVIYGKDVVYRWVLDSLDADPAKRRPPLIRSEILLRELSIFVKNESYYEKFEAAPGDDNHDDAVIAWLIGLVAGDDESFGLAGRMGKPVERVRSTGVDWSKHESRSMRPDEANIAHSSSDAWHVGGWG